MKKWEYKMIVKNNGPLAPLNFDELLLAGEDGWELIGETQYVWTLKRQKK